MNVRFLSSYIFPCFLQCLLVPPRRPVLQSHGRLESAHRLRRHYGSPSSDLRSCDRGRITNSQLPWSLSDCRIFGRLMRNLEVFMEDFLLEHLVIPQVGDVWTGVWDFFFASFKFIRIIRRFGTWCLYTVVYLLTVNILLSCVKHSNISSTLPLLWVNISSQLHIQVIITSFTWPLSMPLLFVWWVV